MLHNRAAIYRKEEVMYGMGAKAPNINESFKYLLKSKEA
jgi:hypothetical protein